MATVVYRIQDAEGRGPYRPGWSHTWLDKSRDESTRPPFYWEFGMHVARKALVGESIGCAFRTMEQLKRWFSDAERKRLSGFGYQVVTIVADRILAESKYQLIFTCRMPLNMACSPVPLSEIDEPVKA